MVRNVPLPRSDSAPTILLQTALLELGPRTAQGHIVQAVTVPWFEVLREIERNPDFLFQFPDDPRRFEELIGGAYEQDGWEVELTPASGDLGRDVIATKPGHLAVRVLDQCKAYSPNYVVTAEDVRALVGVVASDQNASKGVVTTTSKFAPGIAREFAEQIPYRLELRDGVGVEKWLREIAGEEKS